MPYDRPNPLAGPVTAVHPSLAIVPDAPACHPHGGQDDLMRQAHVRKGLVDLNADRPRLSDPLNNGVTLRPRRKLPMSHAMVR